MPAPSQPLPHPPSSPQHLGALSDEGATPSCPCDTALWTPPWAGLGLGCWQAPCSPQTRMGEWHCQACPARRRPAACARLTAHPALTPFTGRDADALRGHVTGPESCRTLCTGSEPHAQGAGGEGWGCPWSPHPQGPLKVTLLMSAHWWGTLGPGDGTHLRSHSETGQLQDQSWVST